MNVKLEENQTDDTMIKYEQGDLSELKFVDPRVIQPISESALDLDYSQGQVDSVLNGPQEDLSDTLHYNSDYTIRMEQCINLDLFLSPIMGDSARNTADELNTPIFDIPKELNVINIQDNTSSIREENPFDFSAEGDKNVGDESCENGHGVETKTISHDTSVVNNSDITDSSLLSPTSAYDMAADADGINLDEYDLLSDYNDAILLSDVFGEEEAETAQNEPSTLEAYNEPETPDTSVCSTDVNQHNYALKLDVGRYTSPTVDLQTPDVINTICSIEKDFNIFSFGQIVKIEDVLQSSADDNSSSIAFSESQPHTSYEEPEDVTIEYAPKKYTRKRKNLSDYENDDDDEDYVPPGKRHRQHHPKRKTTATEGKPEKIKRGRPSQRVSVSSDNSESSKYREMRDKNNEASRRSRQKRRVQEQCYEQECQDLTMKNTKLKAQVSELERAVSTLRSDMMRLMLRK